ATHQRNATAWVAHTRDVLQKMNELSRFLSEAESARRGYVLSGQDFYFERFTNRVARVQVALRQLRALTKDTPRRTAACDQVEPLILQRLTFSTNSIKARQENGLDLEAQVKFMEEGQPMMDTIREIVRQMNADETALLRSRQIIQKKDADGTAGFAV